MIMVVSLIILIVGLLLLQDRHYHHVTHLKESKDIVEVYEELDKFDAKFKELDDYRKRVDALTLRAGFKL
jgi:hypothetical protein